jgi:putative addiction module component (TIGR02574 family)
MSTDSADFLNAALNLPESERAAVAYHLLQSLNPPGILGEDDADFSAELERRAQDREEGRASAADWDDVAERLRDALRQKRPQ